MLNDNDPLPQGKTLEVIVDEVVSDALNPKLEPRSKEKQRESNDRDQSRTDPDEELIDMDDEKQRYKINFNGDTIHVEGKGQHRPGSRIPMLNKEQRTKFKLSVKGGRKSRRVRKRRIEF